MRAGYSFRPRAWPWVLAAIACAGGIALGNWQTRRAEEKRALGERFEQAMRAPAIEVASSQNKNALVGKRVSARGEFVPARSVLLDNKIHRGRAGYEVVTALKLAGSAMHVLVNRGWVAAGPSRERLPEVRTPAGMVGVEGVAQARLPHALQAGSAPAGKVRQNLEIDAFAAETGLALLPFILVEHAGPEDGLIREWPRPDAGVERHQAYALQWYALAALAVVLAAVLSFRKN